ncbi:hypothetical protein [Burkholderia sp. 8Y]|uniref:hypothetical protein n=1 Tax=Burkholderia sp. 8Y TaxID=2653133 RepID=UPI00135AB80B|nr:hypothetical protein [Burkholderia sp. 8Y]
MVMLYRDELRRYKPKLLVDNVQGQTPINPANGLPMLGGHGSVDVHVTRTVQIPTTFTRRCNKADLETPTAGSNSFESPGRHASHVGFLIGFEKPWLRALARTIDRDSPTNAAPGREVMDSGGELATFLNDNPELGIDAGILERA